MNMKDHILTALKEQLQAWEDLLAGLREAQIIAPLAPSVWTIQDVIAHLWAWQQISLARMAAAVGEHDPDLPPWVAALGPGWEDHPDQTNAWVFATYHHQPWPTVYSLWQEGYLRLLQTGKAVAEPDLLAWGKYAWLDGAPLVVILLATYDHHQEHLDQVRGWLAGKPGVDQ